MKNLGGRPRKAIQAAPIENDMPYYTVEEVVKATGLHKHTIQARLRDGTIAGKKIGGVWRIYKDSIPMDIGTHEP